MIVLDTIVVSELMRAEPAAAVLSWLSSRKGTRLLTTSITLAEVFYGIERMPEGRRRQQLRQAADDVFSAFGSHILDFDAEAAEQYAVLAAHRERMGARISGPDAQIAAICRAHSLSLATRNLKDFEETGVELVDPWNTAF